MFHSVGQERTKWSQNWLSVGARQLDAFFKYLLLNNYTTHFAKDVKNIASLDKAVCLTFDDGYLDNYTILYPLVKKYQVKVTVFVNKDFVDHVNTGLRRIHSSSEIKSGKTESLGYLNEKEIIFLDKSPFYDIQSHSCTHDYLFCSNNIMELYSGQDQYHWLAWNLDKTIKPIWFKDDKWKELVPMGYPIFTFDRALAVRAYFPDDELIERITSKFHSLKDIRDLLKIYPGRFETDKEMIERYSFDIGENSEYLSNLLGKEIEVLCWPGGGYNDLSLSLAKKFGIQISTIGTKHIDEDTSLSDHYRLRRFGLNAVIKFKKGYRYFSHSKMLVWKFKSEESLFYSFIFGVIYQIARRL